MEKLTKKEAVRLHREMWRIISEMSDGEIMECIFNIHRIKELALKKMEFDPYNYGNIKNNCFCCEYNDEQIDKSLNCSKCPIIFGNETNASYCFCENLSDSPYFIILTDHENSCNDIRSLAKQISELPEREDNDHDII